MTTATYVRIEPDWEMVFIDDECVLEGHSVKIKNVLEELMDTSIDSVENYHIDGVVDVDFTDRLGEIPVMLAEEGPGLLKDDETA